MQPRRKLELFFKKNGNAIQSAAASVVAFPVAVWHGPLDFPNMTGHADGSIAGPPRDQQH
jgi:hypothetical protein